MTDPIFAEAVEQAVAPESIEAIVLGDAGSYGPWVEGNTLPAELRGVLLSWDDARPYLLYRWDDGHGGEGCHELYLWTATRVYWIHEYDGSTSLAWAPRNPTAIVPEFSGGGAE